MSLLLTASAVMLCRPRISRALRVQNETESVVFPLFPDRDDGTGAGMDKSPASDPGSWSMLVAVLLDWELCRTMNRLYVFVTASRLTGIENRRLALRPRCA
jgi:hypothetical protein